MPGTAEFLKSLPFFHNLGSEELDSLSKKVSTLSFERGQLIFLEGDPSKGLYALNSGRVRVFKTSREGREQVLRIVRPGETFNDVAVFDGGANPASATALETSAAYLIPGDSLLALLRGCPAGLAIIKQLAARVRDLTGLVENLSFRSVVNRLAKLLLETAVNEKGPGPVPRLTQDEMAAMVGSVRDVVGRALKMLEKKGAIKIQGHRIMVVSVQKLKDMS